MRQISDNILICHSKNKIYIIKLIFNNNQYEYQIISKYNINFDESSFLIPELTFSENQIYNEDFERNKIQDIVVLAQLKEEMTFNLFVNANYQLIWLVFNYLNKNLFNVMRIVKSKYF